MIDQRLIQAGVQYHDMGNGTVVYAVNGQWASYEQALQAYNLPPMQREQASAPTTLPAPTVGVGQQNSALAITANTAGSALPAHLQNRNRGSAFTQSVSSRDDYVKYAQGFFQFVQGDTVVQQMQGEINIVLLDSTPYTASRVYYDHTQPYVQGGNNKPPICWSTDGVTPDANAPVKQSQGCAGCPMNVKGRAQDGKSKLCSYTRKIVVSPVPGNGTPPSAWVMNVNAGSIFGPSKDNQSLNFGDLCARLKTIAEGATHGVVIKVTPDPSGNHKLLFTPVRYLDQNETQQIERFMDEEAERLTRMVTLDFPVISDESDAGNAAAQPSAPAQPMTTAPSQAAPFAPTSGDFPPFNVPNNGQQPMQQPMQQPVQQPMQQPQGSGAMPPPNTAPQGGQSVQDVMAALAAGQSVG